MRSLQPEARLQVDSFLRTVAASPASLLMIDYDGTVAPFQVDKSLALPYPGVTELLREIMDQGHTRLAIVSGRDASDVVPLLRIDPAPDIWGLHGLQRRTPDGNIHTYIPDEKTDIGLRDAQRWIDYQQLQHATEVKGASVAVHWRGLDPSDAEERRGRVLMGWSSIAHQSGLRLLDFDGGLEICARHTDKGIAVRALLEEVGPDTPAAYLGDDVTDECAFRALAGRGLSVLVRQRYRKSSAQVWIHPPEDLILFLTQWLAASSANTGLGSESKAAANS
ncbi:MAG: trehalose-phosphatase [Acidobacteria bacterium]|nr:trehalose-phosphatase [Acidobacteriota bacterium]